MKWVIPLQWLGACLPFYIFNNKKISTDCLCKSAAVKAQWGRVCLAHPSADLSPASSDIREAVLTLLESLVWENLGKLWGDQGLSRNKGPHLSKGKESQAGPHDSVSLTLGFESLLVGSNQGCESPDNSLQEKSASSRVDTYPETKRKERRSCVVWIE